jgi:hypothetical protein
MGQRDRSARPALIHTIREEPFSDDRGADEHLNFVN